MAIIDIKSSNAGGGSGGGNLQLLSGAAMTATPTAVTDTANTQSILKLSTNLVQINGTLNFPKSYGANLPNVIITTQNQPDPNNFSIQRESCVSIGANYVQDGVNSIQTGEANTYIGMGLSVIGNSNSYFNTVIGYNASITVNEPKNVVIGARTICSNAECVIIGDLATSTGNTGIAIGTRSSVTANSGTAIGFLATTSTINGFALGNSNSLLQIGGNFVPTARVHVRGLGATSATTTLLIENSLSNSALTIKDDLTSTFGGSVSVGATIVASAILQADSTTKGFLPPRMTDAQIRAIVAPAEGLIAYNTDISHLCCYQAGVWVKFNHSPM